MKWYCTDCGPSKTAGQSNACPACCGFTSLDDDLRGRIGDVVIAAEESPLLRMARAVVPEVAASLLTLERVAAGEQS